MDLLSFRPARSAQFSSGVDNRRAADPPGHPGHRIKVLDLLPATLSLARLELVGLARWEDRIHRALTAVVSDYDYVALDLAPSLSIVSLGALVAATHIVAPVRATKLAAFGTFSAGL